MTPKGGDLGAAQARAETYKRYLFVAVALLVAIGVWELSRLADDVEQNTADITQLIIAMNSLSGSVTTLSGSVDRLTGVQEQQLAQMAELAGRINR